MLLEQPLELAPERRKAAGLDLDQRLATDKIDDVAADRMLDQIAGPRVPRLDLGMERALVQRSDHGPSCSPQCTKTPASASGSRTRSRNSVRPTSFVAPRNPVTSRDALWTSRQRPLWVC